MTIRSRSVRLPSAPPPSEVLAAASSPRTFWAGPEQATVVGSGAAATITTGGPSRFEDIESAADSVFRSLDVRSQPPPIRPRLFGGFAFHRNATESSLWTGYPGARFVLPGYLVTYTATDTWLTLNVADSTDEAVESRIEAVRTTLSGRADRRAMAPPPGIVSRERSVSKSRWRDDVTSVTEQIAAGTLRKVVLSQALETELAEPISIPSVVRRLGNAYPDCFRFLVELADGGKQFFGASPERLLDRRDRAVTTEALAGTVRRGRTASDDDRLAESLMNDRKNAREHDLVSSAIRRQLEPYAASIRTDDRRIRTLETVQHIETPITARLAADAHVLELVDALHPTPAVGGLPPAAALRTIRETEPFERGWYAAPVGWFDDRGDGSFAVALRSALANGDTASLFAGVGIVRGSDPRQEWDEIGLKYRPILDVLE